MQNETFKLFVWLEGDETRWSSEIPHRIEHETAVLLNFGKQEIHSYDVETKMYVRRVEKNHLKSLVTFMNNTFIPSIMS